MSPNPLNVNIKYGNSEKTLKSIDTSTKYVSMSTEGTGVAKAKENVRGGSGMEKMILLSDSEIYDVAMDVFFGKYSNGEERRKKLEEAGYDYDTIQAKVNELLPTYLFAKEAIEKKYREDDIDRLSKEKGLNADEVKEMIDDLKGLSEKERLEKEKLEQKKKEKEEAISTLTDVVNQFSDMSKPLKTMMELENKKKVSELSEALGEKAYNEYDAARNYRTDSDGNPLYHTSEYKYGEWCANFATWVWKNTSVDGKSAYDIAKLDSSFTSSTGLLMMHFLTADHSDLGRDYSGCVYYDSEVNNNIAFYYNDHISEFEGKNSNKLPEGEKNYVPKAGDIVFFDVGGHAEDWKPLKGNNPYDSNQDHTEIVKSLITNDAGEVIGIVTIGGNISGQTAGFYERKIYFNDSSDKYFNGLIGYGAITNVPNN